MNKQELKYLAYATLFAFLVFGYIIPYVIDGNIGNLSPAVQFLVFNIGIFVFLQIFLKSMVLNTKMNITGTIGIIALFMALDILMPPLMVSPTGDLSAASTVTLSASASDYMVGLLGQSIGIHGFLLYLFTYIAAPLVLLIIAKKLVPNFVRAI